MKLRIAATLLFVAALAASITQRTPATAQAPDDAAIARGRFLINYGGCNDCHTRGWDANPGNIPEAQRLTGNPVGFQGPWGTSYAINLRIYFARVPEARWMALVANPRDSHPPMPWWNVQQLPQSDLHAMYAYVHSLGEAGERVPNFVPPGGAVTTQVIRFVPASPAP